MVAEEGPDSTRERVMAWGRLAEARQIRWSREGAVAEGGARQCAEGRAARGRRAETGQLWMFREGSGHGGDRRGGRSGPAPGKVDI